MINGGKVVCRVAVIVRKGMDWSVLIEIRKIT
jgi:hypothetical protein